MTGSKTQQAKGLAKQVEGKVQKGVGNVEEAMEKADMKRRMSGVNYFFRRVASRKNVTAVALSFLLGLNEKVLQRRYILRCRSLASGGPGSDPSPSRHAIA